MFVRLCRRLAAAALLVPLTLALGPTAAHAQEFQCDVTVDYRQLSGSRYTYLDELEELVEEYINENTWTEDRYQVLERIRCTMQIVFDQAVTLTSFRARLILTMERPIYGTTSSTTVLRVNDDQWQFEYAQGTPLIFEPERFHPFTSVLDYYVYLMLGYDYDSFSELGGTPHLRKAQRVVDLAQTQGGIGWSQVGDDRNRAALIRQILDPRFQALRTAYFTYHFGGLDHFVTETEQARRHVLDTLAALQGLYNEVSRQYVLDLFFDTKYQELVAIFLGSPLSQQAYALLNQVDTGHLTEYNRLIQ